MKLTKEQARQLRALSRMKDEDIDLSDMPEKLDWSKAVRGKFYRPGKKTLTLQIDVEVYEWIEKQGKGCETRINQYLREAMLRTKKTAGAALKRKRAS
jgi:uncharacterized protein (DUF4415 family)